MFEAAELGNSVDKKTFEKTLPELRSALLDAQFDLKAAPDFPVIVLVGGVDGAGKGETVNALNAWMDPRHIQTNAMGAPTDEERERPPMWRFWRALPPKGKIGIFFGSWYTQPIVARAAGETDEAAFERSVEEILRFEKMLADEGALLVKLWFHLSKEQQRRRLKALEKDPRTRWRVSEEDWRGFKRYDAYRQVSERALRRTSKAHAPWTVIEGADERYRLLAAARTLLGALQQRLAAPAARPPVLSAPLPSRLGSRSMIDGLDMSARLAREDYRRQREELQGKLALLLRSRKFGRRAAVVVLEGSDAAGKGGAIRRIIEPLDARHYRIVPIAAPTEEERQQPYLWRFWRQVPGRGSLAIFDRSWYGRVLVERVEGFAAPPDWLRAYGEINDFEEELSRHGIVVVKFWLAIDKEEQARRFRERESTPFKRFKLTEEDWRNREKWDLYAEALHDMVERTSTAEAPWTLVAANDKNHTRIAVLRTLYERLREAV